MPCGSFVGMCLCHNGDVRGTVITKTNVELNIIYD